MLCSLPPSPAALDVLPFPTPTLPTPPSLSRTCFDRPATQSSPLARHCETANPCSLTSITRVSHIPRPAQRITPTWRPQECAGTPWTAPEIPIRIEASPKPNQRAPLPPQPDAADGRVEKSFLPLCLGKSASIAFPGKQAVFVAIQIRKLTVCFQMYRRPGLVFRPRTGAWFEEEAPCVPAADDEAECRRYHD